MRYLSVAEIAKKWNISERSVRNYCAHGRVPGAFLTGKTWNIPEDAEKPERLNKKKEHPLTLLDILQDQKASKYSGGIYHKTQIDLTYNSNHIEGSRLTHEQTRYIFETNTIGVENEVLNVDDVIETDLSTEEIAALSALHTYYPTTTISNDAGCDMTAAYVTQYYQGVGDAMFYGVADNLTTEASGTSVLDAHQGKVLDNKIGALNDLETTAKSSAVAAMADLDG